MIPNSDPLKRKVNGVHHTGLGLHADKACCIRKVRILLGSIPKFSHPYTASLSQGTPTSNPILTPYIPKQRGFIKLAIGRPPLPTYSRGPLPPTRSKIPRQHPKTLSPTGYIFAIIWLQSLTLIPPLTHYNQAKEDHLVGSIQASCHPQGRIFRDLIHKLCLSLVIVLPLLATVPNFDHHSDPLKSKETGVH